MRKSKMEGKMKLPRPTRNSWKMEGIWRPNFGIRDLVPEVINKMDLRHAQSARVLLIGL